MASDQIQFNYIPGSGLVAPIFTFEVNSGGQYSSVDRIVLIGHKTSAGTLAFNTPTPVSALQQAYELCGPNSMLREMVRIALQNAPVLPLWIMAIDDSALTALVFSITIGGTPAVGVGVFELMGETLQISVGPTDTLTTIAASVAAAINGYYNPLSGAMLPFTATAASAVVTITAANKGSLFDQIAVYVPPGLSNVFNGASVFTGALVTSGAGTPTGVAAALAALGDNPADAVVCPWSDSVSLAAYTLWGNDVSGRWSWARQSYGHVWCAAVLNFSGLTTLGLSENDRHTTIIGCFLGGANGTPHPTYLWVTAIAARLFPWLTDVTDGNIARSHAGLNLIGIRPPRDASIWPSYDTLNVLNNSGISTWSAAHDGTALISKIITTYQTGPEGQPDAVFRDIQAMYQCSEGLKYMRAGLATLFGQKAIANSNPGSLGAIVTPADIKAGFVNIYSELCVNGVFQDASTFASLIQVAINDNNPDRVDVYCPLERVNPLDILAANATVYQQFPNAALSAAGSAAVAIV